MSPSPLGNAFVDVGRKNLQSFDHSHESMEALRMTFLTKISQGQGTCFSQHEPEVVVVKATHPRISEMTGHDWRKFQDPCKGLLPCRLFHFNLMGLVLE